MAYVIDRRGNRIDLMEATAEQFDDLIEEFSGGTTPQGGDSVVSGGLGFRETTAIVTARYVMGARGARLVHQVRRAQAKWYEGLADPLIGAVTLCGLPLGGGQGDQPRFAHSCEDFEGATPCCKCEVKFSALRVAPVWKGVGHDQRQPTNTPRMSSSDRRELQELIETGRARELRIAAGDTLAAAGRAVEVDPSAVLHWERGRMPRGRNVRAYFAYLSGLTGTA